MKVLYREEYTLSPMTVDLVSEKLEEDVYKRQIVTCGKRSGTRKSGNGKKSRANFFLTQ